MVDARVVAHVHLGQPEVGALAGVARDDVVDHDAAVSGGDLAHASELLLGAERLVEARADPVEVTVDAGRGLPARDAARPLHWSGVHRGDARISKAAHRPSSPKVARKDSPALVIMDIG